MIQHAIVWQAFFKMDQEDKIYEALIQRSKTALEKKTKYEAEQKRNKLQMISEISSSEDEIESPQLPNLNDLEQLIEIGQE